MSKIPVDETGEEPDLCIVEVRSVAIQSHALLLSQVVSLGERSAISSPRPSWRHCGNSSSASVMKILLLYTYPSCRICMESRRQSRHRQLCTPCAGSACYLIWSVFGLYLHELVPMRVDCVDCVPS